MAVAFAGVLSACAIRSESAEPADVQLELVFPSPDAAVRVDVIQVLVYDNPNQDPDLCARLMFARQNGLDAPQAPVASTPIASVCSFLRQTATSRVQAPFGPAAILVAASRAVAEQTYQDFLLGCSQQVVGDGDAAVAVQLARTGDVTSQLPKTECTSLAQFCSASCDRSQ